MSILIGSSISDWLTPGSAAIDQAVRRAASPGYESWWARCAAVGFCTNPIQASAYDPNQGKRVAVMIRCGNRRAAICPSCSDLYAADTWQLVHAGAAGGHHDMPTTVADRPQVFTTLTAPSFGAVHASGPRPGGHGGPCHPADHGKAYCPHGKPLWCNMVHRGDDPDAGQPLCPECYDYTGHVLFNWHAPELWRRFTIALRRSVSRHLRRMGADPDTVRVSFVKVAEYQRRAIIHYHTLIRLDPTDDSQDVTGHFGSAVSAAQLAALVRQAACEVRLAVSTPTSTADPDTGSQDRVLRFGTQIDTQPLTAAADTAEPTPGLARRVAGYLAKYTTKSVAEFGIAARRISPQAIADLDLPAHSRHILSTLTGLATLPGNAAMLAWLHTLGYRGHITTKSRRYSTTMTALRAIRHHWRQHRPGAPEDGDHQNTPEEHDHSSAISEFISWRIQGAGHHDDGERLLVHTAAHQARQHRCLARLEARDHAGASP
jgi:hypothetical protein